MIDHEYITLKLVNGDNLIALMVGEKDDSFIVLYPIQMKSVKIQHDGVNKEILAGTPWCSFTDDEVYTIWKDDVVLLKPLNESTIQYYKKLVEPKDIKYELEETESNLFATSFTIH